MIDNKTSKHENLLDAHAVSVSDGNGGYTPLDEALKTQGGGGSSAPADGSLTPVKLAGYDGNTGHGKVPKVKGDGTGFDFVDLPDAYTPPAADAAIADLADDANAAAIVTAFNKLLAAARTHGIIAAK